jgi:hypothetical protein
MAKPLILFENDIWENGTLTETSEVANFPHENMLDWRMSTPDRWKATSTATQELDCDIGAATGQPTCAAIGGHNLSTVSATWRVLYSDNGSSYTEAFSAQAPADDLPQMQTFTMGSAHRYWRLEIAGSPTAAAQIGVFTLGRELEFESGPQADLDPYGFEVMRDQNRNEHGSFLGSNVRHIGKRFNVNYGEPGMTVSGFYDKSGINFDDDFVPHLEAAKPFWFAWNLDVDATEVYLCDSRDVRMPWVGTTLRRGLQMTLTGYREVS